VGAAGGRRRAAGATRRCRGRLLEPPIEPKPAGATRGATRRCSPGSRSGGAAHRRAPQREQPPPPDHSSPWDCRVENSFAPGGRGGGDAKHQAGRRRWHLLVDGGPELHLLAPEVVDVGDQPNVPIAIGRVADAAPSSPRFRRPAAGATSPTLWVRGRRPLRAPERRSRPVRSGLRSSDAASFCTRQLMDARTSSSPNYRSCRCCGGRRSPLVREALWLGPWHPPAARMPSDRDSRASWRTRRSAARSAARPRRASRQRLS